MMAANPIAFLDLKASNAQHRVVVLEACARVVDSRW